MVSPVHVIVTVPAATVAPAARVMVISGIVPPRTDGALGAGEDTSHA